MTESNQENILQNVAMSNQNTNRDSTSASHFDFCLPKDIVSLAHRGNEPNSPRKVVEQKRSQSRLKTKFTGIDKKNQKSKKENELVLTVIINFGKIYVFFKVYNVFVL